MKTRAAVALEAGKKLEVMEVNLDGPKEGEVMVEIKATGICHTDEFTRSGADPEGLFPAILGHEGAGVVVEVGPGVKSVKPGDHVIPLYTPECRECASCLSGKTNLCTRIRATQGQGLMPDGTSRFSMPDGTPIHHYMGCSTFSNFTVLPEIAVASAGTPSGGKAAGKYGASMLCVAASDSGGFNVLDTNWQIACETAAEYGNTMDRRNLRLVAPMHIAETREQAFKNVEWGLDEWGDYYELASPNPFKARGKELPKKLVESKRAVIGTPDDAIEMIERMQGKQGEFGVFLAQHVDWADPEATRKSYELYARYVMPHFARANTNRRATQDWMIEQNANFQDRRKGASDAAFAQHEAEQAEKKAQRKAGE